MDYPAPTVAWRVPRPPLFPFNSNYYLPKNGYPQPQGPGGSYLAKRSNMSDRLKDRRRFRV